MFLVDMENKEQQQQEENEMVSFIGQEFCDFIGNLQSMLFNSFSLVILNFSCYEIVYSKIIERKMLSYCAQDILERLDDKTLMVADEVSATWKKSIIEGCLLQKLLARKVYRLQIYVSLVSTNVVT